jgi:hypothetical protein
MKIVPDGLPFAGQLFSFKVDGDLKPIMVQVYIASELHYEADCPDPPCHEMTMIPVTSQDTVLQIVIRDRSGGRLAKSFIIGPPGGTLSVGGKVAPRGDGGVAPAPGANI